MANPYLGEIRLFAGNFAPQGWSLCNGQLLSVSDNNDLFSLIGTTYGGDGQSTFALPDLRSRIPVHVGPGGYNLGGSGGAESVMLVVSNLPTHTHSAQGAASGNSGSPGGNFWAGTSDLGLYTTGGQANESMALAAIGTTGGGQAHDNMMPYFAINFIMALAGIYPSPN